MAFQISENLIRVYQDGIDSIIDQLGRDVTLILPQKEDDCPNCGYDAMRKRSNNKYNASNPNPAGPLNKPFVNGQVCPVCQGRGKLKSTKRIKVIKATVRWNPKDYVVDDSGKMVNMVYNNMCKIKTYATYYHDVKHAVEFLVPSAEVAEANPEMLKCKLTREPSARGLKYSRYIEVFLKRSNA